MDVIKSKVRTESKYWEAWRKLYIQEPNTEKS